MKPILPLLIALSILAIDTARAEVPEPSLYQRLGGTPVVAKVIEQAIDRMAADPAVNRSFDGINLQKLDARIVEQVCALAAGGCVYGGDDMKSAHDGMNIDQREFYALVEALRAALDANGVREREKNELLRLLAPMKRDVVTR